MRTGRQRDGLLIGLYGLVALPVLALALLDLSHLRPESLWIVGGIAVLLGLAGSFTVRLPGTRAWISLAEPAIFTALLLGGPGAAILLGVADGISGTLRARRRLRTGLASTAVVVLAAAGGAGTFDLLAPRPGADGTISVPALGGALLFAALVQYGINAALVSLLDSAREGIPPLVAWKERYLWALPSFPASACFALGAFVAERTLGPIALFLGVPVLVLLYLLYWSHTRRLAEHQAHVEKLQRLHEQTLDAFSLAIDARNPAARGHARRVQAYARLLGRLVMEHDPGLADEEDGPLDEAFLEALGNAALLHDIGKLGLPDHALRESEWAPGHRARIREHPSLGAAMLAGFQDPRPIAPMVRHHHERWDGNGYPDGLAGRKIPLGARIIALADALDWAWRSRPDGSYPSLSALTRMVAQEAGTRFDPRLADLYCTHAEEIEQALAEQETTTVCPPGSGKEDEEFFANVRAAQEEADFILHLARRLGETIHLEQVLDVVAEELLTQIPADACVVYLPDRLGGRLEPRTVRSGASDLPAQLLRVLGRDRFARGEGNVGWVHETGQPLIDVDPRIDLGDAASLTDPPLRTAAVFPVSEKTGQSPVAVVAFYSREEGAFRPDHWEIFRSVAPRIARAIGNALLYEETRATSMTDALTGLPNSRYLYSQLEKEIARVTRKGLPLAVVVMDLDGFKPVNDTYGHQAGDYVLQQVAQLLRDTFRSGDTVCRYAGDEFVAILPETTPEEARKIVERVQDRVGSTPIRLPSGEEVRVGVSAGRSCFPLDGSTLEELIHRADKEMYRDKARRHAAGAPSR